MNIRLASLIIIFLIPFTIKAVTLDIGVFYKMDKTEILFTSLTGKYNITANHQMIGESLKGKTIQINLFQDSLIQCYQNNKLIGQFSEIHFNGKVL